jgi:hypothetical protein
MSDKKMFKNTERTEGEKILYGVSQKACFACGEKIERNTDICPYCKTAIK